MVCGVHATVCIRERWQVGPAKRTAGYAEGWLKQKHEVLSSIGGRCRVWAHTRMKMHSMQQGRGLVTTCRAPHGTSQSSVRNESWAVHAPLPFVRCLPQPLAQVATAQTWQHLHAWNLALCMRSWLSMRIGQTVGRLPHQVGRLPHNLHACPPIRV